jgi:hypothetical protein
MYSAQVKNPCIFLILLKEYFSIYCASTCGAASGTAGCSSRSFRLIKVKKMISTPMTSKQSFAFMVLFIVNLIINGWLKGKKVLLKVNSLRGIGVIFNKKIAIKACFC